MREVSPVFRYNQAGYAAGLPVHVAVLAEGTFRLADRDGRVLRTFEVSAVPEDPASGDRVRLVNLGVLPEGKWTLEGAGGKCLLTVSPRPWQDVTDALVKGLYYQRCGCGLPEKYAGLYSHPACHTAPAADWEDRSAVRRVTGGWHDAGDYGKYTGPGAVTAAHLMYAWKLFPGGFSEVLDIPESGNGVPDVLNETRFELEWLLQMQRADGAFHHKLTKAQFAPFIMPQDDTNPEYLMPVSHCATGAACACLALGSRIYRAWDAAFADRMLQSAAHGWKWLKEHPEFVPYRNPEGVRTGWYGDGTDADERFWAACELYAATGEEAYRQEAETLYAAGLHLTQFGWADVAGMGALCCLFDLKEKAGEILYTKLKEEFLRQSVWAASLSEASGYGTALAPDQYIWGSILPIMSNAMALIMDSLLTGRQESRDAALIQWDYALGCNALDLCFITGFGERSVMHPHHRPSEADGVEAPVPGLISGGPNKKSAFWYTKGRLSEEVPPAKYYVDEMPSADTNEIAIYWNSPAAFTGAYFSMLSGKTPAV